MSASDIFEKGDLIDNLPPLARANWLRECELVLAEINAAQTILQAGCTSGGRIIALKEKMHDIDITGLDFDPELIARAKARLPNTRFILADIENPSLSEKFGVVLCLDNMLGYLKDERKSIAEMKALAKEKLIVSVYGEKFSDQLAQDYFKSIGTGVKRIEGNLILTKEFKVKRYAKKDLHALLGDCKITETPIGWFCVWSTNH